MSDNYSFMKSSITQDTGDYSPYIDKQYNNYINDINNGVYTNNSLTLVNFDLKNDWGEKLHAIVNRLLQWKNVKTPMYSL